MHVSTETGHCCAGSKLPLPGLGTLAAFVICVVSGIMLALAFRPDAPLDSLALLMMKNPAGIFVRSVHYWSAQLFLIFSVLHVADHLSKGGESKVRFAVWARLSLTILVILFGMLSGFFLRADPESIQAVQVCRTMLNSIPFAGASLARILTGTGSDFFVIYLHHVCTVTLVIWLTTIDHSRRTFPAARSTLWTLLLVAVIAFSLTPGLADSNAPVEKGPWYFIGLQELLHWMPGPQWFVWIALPAFGIFILLPKFPAPIQAAIKRSMTWGAFAYLTLSAIGICFRGEGWKFEITGSSQLKTGFQPVKAYTAVDPLLIDTPVPMINGNREGCLVCHGEMTGFPPAHDPKSIGCAACHLGNRFTLNKDLAHAAMTRTPGNLSMVARTCATANCHSEIEARVRSSLMNNMSGVVVVDKYVFGESTNLGQIFNISALGHSASDSHLRNLCASCHLGQDKTEPAMIDESSRGGGCSSCHLRYNEQAAAELSKRGNSSGQTPKHHPEISVNVPSQACFGCHSRSGRISTSYEGWHETLLEESAVKGLPDWKTHYRILPDGRVFEKRQKDIHFEKGMECTDCHVASEVMGDNRQHAHKEEALKISCIDCHAEQPPATATFPQLDAEAQKIVALRNLNEPGRKFVLTKAGSTAYPNVFLDAEGKIVVKEKNNQQILKPKPLSPDCGRNISAHQKMECRTCHSAWAPQCLSCHTSLDSASKGWDHLNGKLVQGVWQEKPGDYLAEPPILGVEQMTLADGKKQDRIATFVPGMIMTLEQPSKRAANSETFHRLYAPASPHTIVSQARDCVSCHANPAALGYGRGQLTYEIRGNCGTWKFEPKFPPSARDGLPMDAWVGFLKEPLSGTATRRNIRPFRLQEQQKILLVGACLQCHKPKDPRLAPVFSNFEDYPARISTQCRLPDWTN